MNKEERLRDGQEVWVKGVIKGRSDAEAIEGYLVLLHGEEEIQWFERAALADPAPTLERTAKEVVGEWRSTGSQDWEQLVSAINLWAMTDFCPRFTGERK